MDHEAHEAAVLAVTAADAAAHTARALAVFDALDAHAEHLTGHDRYDFAWSTWHTFTSHEGTLSDEAFATVLLRAARHLPESTVIDFVDAEFPDAEKQIRLADGTGFVWLPDDDALIISTRHGDTVADSVLIRASARAKASL